LFQAILSDAARVEAEGEAGQDMVTAAEPKAPLLPQHRKDVDDAPVPMTNMEREALARGEKITEVPLQKMEMLMGPGWFSHGTG
jgi:hypothetical protein